MRMSVIGDEDGNGISFGYNEPPTTKREASSRKHLTLGLETPGSIWHTEVKGHGVVAK